MSLPLLDAMLPIGRAGNCYLRAIAFDVLIAPDGAHMPAWTPAAEGAGYALFRNDGTIGRILGNMFRYSRA